jgi:NADPH-dependent curcumin reductase
MGSSSSVNRRVVLTQLAEGLDTPPRFELREAPVPTPQAGEILVRNHVISCDPTQFGWLSGRATYVPRIMPGDVMRAWCAGEVMQSRHPDFVAGDRVWGTFSWQDYVTSDGSGIFPVRKIPADLPLSYPLGVTGITGVTAYLGMVELGRVQASDTVVVSTAAGATGSAAAQIAKFNGARVIGIAGGPEKCEWLQTALKLDGVIDYRKGSVVVALEALCPKGVDLYFDNVGGDVLDSLLLAMAERGRVMMCGATSQYASAWTPLKHAMMLNYRRLSLRGYLIFDHLDRFDAASEALTQWVRQGRLIAREDVVEGLEHAPVALGRLLEGKNIGKQLVLVADGPRVLGPHATRHRL